MNGERLLKTELNSARRKRERERLSSVDASLLSSELAATFEVNGIYR